MLSFAGQVDIVDLQDVVCLPQRSSGIKAEQGFPLALPIWSPAGNRSRLPRPFIKPENAARLQRPNFLKLEGKLQNIIELV